MFRTILDSHLLRDGGSLVMSVERDDGDTITLWLDRSIHARRIGTDGRVTSDGRGGRSRSGDEAREAADALERVPATDHPVAEFVTALRKQA